MLVPALLGYHRYVITSGSMSGTFDRGAIIYDDAVAVSELRVGDVITYTPPPDSGKTGRVTHRIVWVGRNAGGERAFQTKGDANPTADPWKFALPERPQARVAFHVPYLGYAFAALSERKVRMLVIALPALLVALSVLAGMWREAGRARSAAGAGHGVGCEPEQAAA